jgi:hypothetical protein
MTTTIDSDYGGDEEKTLPPPPPHEPAILACPARPSAYGDFRTYYTTFAAFGDGDVVEVQLISELGHHAHFAMDRELAARVAYDLERQLSEADRHDRGLSFRPPKLAPLADPGGTDVCFTGDEALRVMVKQETGGDRIVLGIWSDEATLHITMQSGVAVAVWRFLARAAGRPR